MAMMGLLVAFGFCSPALAQRAGGKDTAPAICIGTGWARTCQAHGGWAPINPDPRSFGNVYGDAKWVPPN